MRLSDHFTLEEMTRTSTGLPNVPSDGEIEKLKELSSSVLEPIRAEWGAIRIDSGFRCADVNEKVGGVPSSQHCLGEAADIVPMEADLDIVFDWIVRASSVRFGQCIREDKGKGRWIHVSLPRADRENQEALVYDGHRYRPYTG
jgi:zinc D-Ala-D-Ala carboxypeptidase